MTDDRFKRNEILIGEKGQKLLKNCRVAVFGIGGVGGYAAEALARSGIGKLDLIDKDTVDITNLNRQIVALESTVGQFKTEVMRRRISDINPECEVKTYNIFYLPETADEFDFNDYDYIVDAVDNVTAKIELCLRANECGTPIISSMGTGNKLCPELLRIDDIYKTTDCPLARVMRKELRARAVKELKVVYSTEKSDAHFDENGALVTSSMVFVPASAGLLIASEVVRDLLKKE